jgi:hypothetical protein
MRSTRGFHPFDDGWAARWIADYFRREIFEREKFDGILASAPLWLLPFTWAEITISYLELGRANDRIWPIIGEVLVCITCHCKPDPWELSSYDRPVFAVIDPHYPPGNLKRLLGPILTRKIGRIGYRGSGN